MSIHTPVIGSRVRPCPVDAIRIGRRTIHLPTLRVTVGPVMIADCLAVPVDLAVVDMGRLIGGRSSSISPRARSHRNHRPKALGPAAREKCGNLHRSSSATAADQGDITWRCRDLFHPHRAARLGSKRGRRPVLDEVVRVAPQLFDDSGERRRSGADAITCHWFQRAEMRRSRAGPCRNRPRSSPVANRARGCAARRSSNQGRPSRRRRPGTYCRAGRGPIGFGRPGRGSNHITPHHQMRFPAGQRLPKLAQKVVERAIHLMIDHRDMGRRSRRSSHHPWFQAAGVGLLQGVDHRFEIAGAAAVKRARQPLPRTRARSAPRSSRVPR